MVDEFATTTTEIPSSVLREHTEKASLELSKALAILDLAEGYSAGSDDSGIDLGSVFAVLGDLIRNGKDLLDQVTVSMIETEAVSLQADERDSAASGSFGDAYGDFVSAIAALEEINKAADGANEDNLGPEFDEKVRNVISRRNTAAEKVFSIRCQTHSELMKKLMVARVVAWDADDVVPESNSFPSIIESVTRDVALLSSVELPDNNHM